MKIYAKRTCARISDRKSATSRAQEALRGEEGAGQCDVDGGGDKPAGRKSSAIGFDAERADRKDSEIIFAQDDGGANLGGVADQFAADCLKRLAENKAQIKAHQSAVASLEKSNKLLNEQLSRIQELKDKLNQSED
jgi:hypothetical protein